ncbi:FAD-dependent oxidoreductase [Kitasatospora kifunensis]|uniref:2-polyprenyl-6-methoxyphenol hydroxylase-like FAD-dependent oxidoreductase n=1 Tax=Kitasatospora kifunensis TaxID=58351 RepID=A0A7W7QWU5_KITKI|nr:NAD(P)/FAD-dependent oxidoreductase [Kitasatospora kifunensis]MBB4921064.1 2-polyprenyl-6-methoxyphenol hydroxylase-like FAD-dependent oxidoreductase [Kitasatospora kifunensis]
MIIAGAGLGGLTLAHGLRAQGIDVAVYERDAHPGARPQGYRVQLDEPGLTNLQYCLPAPLFELCLSTAGAPPARVSVRNRHLDILADKAAAQPPGVVGPHAFNRPTLRQIMLLGLGDQVHYGAQLTDCQHNADGTVTARFADGRTASGDLLVGADGVNSAVRRLLLPDAQVEDAGLRLVYGRIPLRGSTRAGLPGWVFDSIFTVVTGGPGQPHLGLGPVEFRRRPDQCGLAPVGDYIACMVGAPVSHPALPTFEELRALTPAALRDLALRLMGEDWHEDVHRLLAHWDTDSLFPLRISTAAPVPPWEPGPVTLIGDAIHAMSPVLAMGANTAIRDAGELTRSLTGTRGTAESLTQAVRGYENRMRDYAFSIVADSRQTGQQRVGQR